MDERFAHLLTRAEDQVEGALRQAGFVIYGGQLSPRQWCLHGWLVHDGVAAQERSTRHTGRKCEREIEWCDDDEHAVWTQRILRALVRRQLAERPDVSVGTFDLVGVIVDEISRFFGVSKRLHAILADLDAHDRRKLIAVGADRISSSAHRSHALLP